VLTTIVSVDPIYFNFDVDERSYLAYSRMLQQGMRSAITGGKADEVVISPDRHDPAAAPRRHELRRQPPRRGERHHAGAGASAQSRRIPGAGAVRTHRHHGLGALPGRARPR
jgi:hypothetical protein